MENTQDRDHDVVIELKNICKSIRGNQILDGISYQFHGNRVYGIRGKNGSGKTMLMRCIAGLIRPTQGEIRIKGKPLDKKHSIPPSIGLLLENPSFLGEYTGFRNLKLLADLKDGLSDRQIEELMIQVGLEEQMNKRYEAYSLGMKQRLGVAAAIMGKPDIILLDEPINAIDGDGVNQIRDVIRDLRAPGRAIIVSCHDLEEMQLLADEILVISEGRIVG